MTEPMQVNEVVTALVARTPGERVYLADARQLCAWYARAYGEALTVDGLTASVLGRFRQACLESCKQRTWMRKRSALRWLIRQLEAHGADGRLVWSVRA